MAGTVIAVVTALAAAGSFGVAGVLQHHQAREAAGGKALRFRLLADLARRPMWLAGIVLAAAAYGLQALALAFGPLALVAPIVATDLLFAVPLAAWWSRRPLRRQGWTGCALVASGIGIFLATSPPASGRSDAPAQEWLPAFGAVALVCMAAVTVGNARGGAVRAAMLAAAAGVTFGLTAAVTLSASRLLRDIGPAATLGHWQPWALITLGLAGLVFSQSAYQAGQLTASLPIIDTLEPISGVVIGTAVFHEHLATSPYMLAIQFSGAAIAISGIALLAPPSLAHPGGDTDHHRGDSKRSDGGGFGFGPAAAGIWSIEVPRKGVSDGSSTLSRSFLGRLPRPAAQSADHALPHLRGDPDRDCAGRSARTDVAVDVWQRHNGGAAGAGGLLFFAPLVMILFRQKYPRWWFDWNLELQRFGNRVGAYLALMDDRYPSTDDHQWVHLDYPYPDVARDLNRWLPIVKWLLSIPTTWCWPSSTSPRSLW